MFNVKNRTYKDGEFFPAFLIQPFIDKAKHKGHISYRPDGEFFATYGDEGMLIRPITQRDLTSRPF